VGLVVGVLKFCFFNTAVTEDFRDVFDLLINLALIDTLSNMLLLIT